MNRIAVDVVLLPDETVTSLAVSVNADLVKHWGSEIVLDPESCLPHVSLVMGGIEPQAIATVQDLLARVGREHAIGELVISGVVTSLNARGVPVSVFALAQTREIRSLHESIMDALQPRLTWEVTEEAIYGDEPIAEESLAWIRNFREKAAHAAFFPHITIGYGAIERVMSFPIRFTATRLAVCHLGNHCTCRQVLASVPLVPSRATE